jgi:hypothetical protein
VPYVSGGAPPQIYCPGPRSVALEGKYDVGGGKEKDIYIYYSE